MARISYIEENDHPELADLIGKIRAGRRGALINVYKLLLHSPPLAAIWLDFVSAARYKTGLDGRLREIVIVRVAHLNRTDLCVQAARAAALGAGRLERRGMRRACRLAQRRNHSARASARHWPIPTP